MSRILALLSIVLFLVSVGFTSVRPEQDGRGEQVQVHPFSELGIPSGHLPPPGECKVWIPGRPAGQQGPPQSCQSAWHNAPLGAWIITHTGKRYQVNILSDSRPQIIIEVRFYALPQ
jgi:hypothetical protein